MGATPVEPLAGAASTGGAGGGATVVKFQTVEYALVPLAFVALTLQKYLVLAARLAAKDVAEMFPWLTSVVTKVLSADTWMRYEVAPVDMFHARVVLVGMPVDPLDGEASTGDGGGVTVVKFQTIE